MKIVLLFGGRSAEHEVSVRSAAYVLPKLILRGYDTVPVGVRKDGTPARYVGPPSALSAGWERYSLPLSLSVRGERLSFLGPEGDAFSPELVFSLLHGTYGEDGAWQGLLTLAKVPFIGSGVLPSALAMNKRVAKELAAHHAIPVTPFVRVNRICEETRHRVECALRYPVFVKPTSQGSSVGVSRVERSEALLPAIEAALAHDNEALVEEAVEGSELEVAVLERDGTLLLSPPGEIRPRGVFFDYDAKYGEQPGADYLLPSPISLWESAYVKQLAATIFRLFGCRDLARVDFLRRHDGRIFFNEINTLPGFTEDSLFPRLLSLIDVDPIAFLLEGRS